MSKTSSLLKRRVQWKELCPSFDNKTHFYKEYSGIVMDVNWIDDTCRVLVMDNDGFLYVKNVIQLRVFVPENTKEIPSTPSSHHAT